MHARGTSKFRHIVYKPPVDFFFKLKTIEIFHSLLLKYTLTYVLFSQYHERKKYLHISNKS